MIKKSHKIDPNAFEDFQRLIKGYVAEMTSANDLKPFAPKTAGEGVSSIKALEDEVGFKSLVHKNFTEYYHKSADLYKDGKKINSKTLVKISKEENRTQDLEVSC